MGWRIEAKEFFLAIYPRKTDRLVTFSRALARSETQTTLPRVRTQVTNSISWDDNRYATCNKQYEAIELIQ